MEKPVSLCGTWRPASCKNLHRQAKRDMNSKFVSALRNIKQSNSKRTGLESLLWIVFIYKKLTPGYKNRYVLGPNLDVHTYFVTSNMHHMHKRMWTLYHLLHTFFWFLTYFISSPYNIDAFCSSTITDCTLSVSLHPVLVLLTEGTELDLWVMFYTHAVVTLMWWWCVKCVSYCWDWIRRVCCIL